MTADRLIAFIASHAVKAVELPSGMLLAEENHAGEGFPDTACELHGPYWSVIEPSLSAVRDWLNY